MASLSPRVAVEVNLKKKPWQQSQPLHNRWHPEIPTVAEVKVGEFFRVEMIDAMGGVAKDNDSAVDIKNMDLTTIRVVDEDGVAAKPGDLLAVEMCNLGP